MAALAQRSQDKRTLPFVPIAHPSLQCVQVVVSQARQALPARTTHRLHMCHMHGHAIGWWRRMHMYAWTVGGKQVTCRMLKCS